VLDEWMSEAEAAAEIDKTVRTLRKWRHKRIGPPMPFLEKPSNIIARPSRNISSPAR
jgi:hypothetical protein